MKVITFLFALALLFGALSNVAVAGGSLQGYISNYTFIDKGALIKLDVGVPSGCELTPYDWMLILEGRTAMMAVVLIFFSERNDMSIPDPLVKVYSGGIGSSGYCELSQIDPKN